MPCCPPSLHCPKAPRGSVTCMKSLGLDASGGLEPRPLPQPLEQCSFCSITLRWVEKLLRGNKFGNGKGEMMAGGEEGAGALRVTAEDGVDMDVGGLGHQGPQLAGAGTSPPPSIRPGAAGCQCCSIKTPPRARNQIFLLPCSGRLIASDSKCIALIFSHFAEMGSILTSLPALKASQKREGHTKVGGKCRGWAINGAAA